MTIDRETLRVIADELTPIIEAALKRHGLDAPKMQWKYGAMLELKMTAAELSEGPNGINLGSREAQYYTRFGFPGLDAKLGTVFSVKGEEFAFAGIAASRRKYPIYAKNIETGAYIFYTEMVVATINAAAKAAV
jgi:hypothetical protein